MFLDQDKTEFFTVDTFAEREIYVDMCVLCLLCEGWKISDV